MKALRCAAFTLVIVGAVNWGLVGLCQFDLVAAIFGSQATVLSRITYVLIGVSALLVIATRPAFSGTVRTRIRSQRVGRSEGVERGPEPGDGAVIHHSSGNADFDGVSGDVLPPEKNTEESLPSPSKRAAR